MSQVAKDFEKARSAFIRHRFESISGYDGVADLDEPSWRLRVDLLRLWSCLPRQEAVEAIRMAWKGGSPYLRELATLQAGLRGGEDLVENLCSLLSGDPSALVRVQAAEALGRVRGLGSEGALEDARSDMDRDVAQRAALALARLREGDTATESEAHWAALDPDQFRTAALGTKPPALELFDTGGQGWTLDSLREDRPLVLVWVFAEWCPVCHHEFDELERLREDYERAGVAVATVECHDLFRCRAMLARHRPWWPHLVDVASKEGLAWGVDPMEFPVHQEWINRPCAFIVDAQGVLRLAYKGTFFGDRPSMGELLTMAREERYDFTHPQRRI